MTRTPWRSAALLAAPLAALLGAPALRAQGPEPLAPGAEPWGALTLLGSVVAPGEVRRTTWAVSETFTGAALPTPVLVVRGVHPGPTLCLTGGIHGDELNGVEVVRRVLADVDPQQLRGTLVGVPIVNLHGFRRGSRYLPDRRDLNRYFPGRSRGSTASRIAFSFFEAVVRRCDYLVDIHTGSFHRTNLPHVRADLDDPATLALSLDFGAPMIVHNQGRLGTLRRAAADAGIPSVTYEAGEPMRFQEVEVQRGEQGVQNLLRARGMLVGRRRSAHSELFRHSRWVRVDDGGILLSTVQLGEEVVSGALLATVTDPITNDRSEVRAPHRGVVIGMALNQVVIPGFAAFHLGVRHPEELAIPPEPEAEHEDGELWDPVLPGDPDFEERPE